MSPVDAHGTVTQHAQWHCHGTVTLPYYVKCGGRGATTGTRPYAKKNVKSDCAVSVTYFVHVFYFEVSFRFQNWALKNVFSARLVPKRSLF